jgi:hypothetical protein
MRTTPLIAAAAGLILRLSIAMVLPGTALAQPVSVGLVTTIQGDATLVRHGQKLKVTQSMALETNDKLITSGDGLVTVTFGDNSTMTLGQSSTLVINEGVASGPSTIKSVGLLGGRLRTILNAGLRQAGGGFEVRTPNALAGVRGTEFTTAYIAGTPCPGFPKCLRYTDVGVYKGEVEVRNPLNPKAAPVIAKAGYETTVPCEEPPATPSPLGMEEMLSPAYR